MEIVYFILGMAVAMVLQILAIMIVHNLKTKLEQLEEEFQFHERGNYDAAVDLHRRIDDEVRELRAHNDQTLLKIKDELRELHTKIDENEREIISLLDSQVYRLTNKINKQQLPKG
jgi:sensor histidine kinase YesM